MADSTIKNLPLVSSIADDMSLVVENSSNTNEELQINQLDARYVVPETSQTINFTSSQTAAQIQADIDAVGKHIPIGSSITFQFANGTYSLDAALDFRGFFGGGNILVYGNTSETNATVKHTTQDVVLDFKGNTVDGLKFIGNTVLTYVYNLRIEVDDTYDGCIFNDCCRYNRFWYNYVLINGTSTNGYGLLAQSNSNVETRANYFTGGHAAIYSLTNGQVYSNDNEDTGTQPLNGLKAAANGTIGKNSTQPSGSSANEVTSAGAEIR